MLTRIRIVNVQKHKDLDLNLDKINVIVGPTDSGKTSVLRALTWALTNDEAGENLINNEGAKSCYVEVTTEDGTIRRAWSKGKNAYMLNDKEFTTFRTGVPDPIKAVLKLDDINIQRRRDLPYMVYAKASECASQFSDMMDLAEIDTVVGNINKAVTARMAAVEQVRDRRNTIEDELGSLAMLDEVCNAYEALAKRQEAIAKAEQDVERLKMLLERLSAARCEFAKVNDPAEAEFALQLITEQNDEWQRIYNERNKAFSLYDMWMDASIGVRSLEGVAELTDYIRILNNEYNDYEEVRQTLSKYSDIYNKRKTLINVEAESMQQVLDAQTAFNSEFPNICPLCGKENCND